MTIDLQKAEQDYQNADARYQIAKRKYVVGSLSSADWQKEQQKYQTAANTLARACLSGCEPSTPSWQEGCALVNRIKRELDRGAI